MDDVIPTQNGATEKDDKPNNQFEKKIHRQLKYRNNKYKVESWDNKNKNVLLRNFYIDLLLNKRGIFIKSSSPQDYVKKCDSEECKDAVNPVLAAGFKYKRRQKELRRRKEGVLEAKAGTNKKLNEYSEKKRETFKKSSRKNKNSQPVMKDRLDILLGKIHIHT